MDAARDLAGGVEALDGLQAHVEHAGVDVGLHAAHGVVDLRPQAGGVEGGGVDGDGVLGDGLAELLVVLGLDDLVVALHLGQEGVDGHPEVLGELLEAVELPADAGLQAPLELAAAPVGHVGVAGDLDERLADLEDHVAVALAVGELVDAALAGPGVDAGGVAGHRVDPGRAHAVALLVGAAPRAALDPVEVHGQGAALDGGAEALGGGAGGVGAVDGPVQARVVLHAPLDVAAEAARGQDHAAAGLDVEGLAGGHVVVRGARAQLGAHDAAALVLHQVCQHGPGLDLDAHLGEPLLQRQHDGGAVGAHGVQGAHGGVAAVGDRLGLAGLLVHLPLNAEHVARPLPGLVGPLGDDAALLDVVEEESRHLHVADVLLDGVLDALGLLARRAAHGEVAVGDEGVSAHDGELLDHLDVGAGGLGLVGGGKARVARADDQDVALLVEGDLVGGQRRLGLAAGQGRGGQARGGKCRPLDEGPAVDVLHCRSPFAVRGPPIYRLAGRIRLEARGASAPAAPRDDSKNAPARPCAHAPPMVKPRGGRLWPWGGEPSPRPGDGQV